AWPVPVSATLRGLPRPLSVTTSVPVREPAAGGLDVTLMAQFPDAATEAPHVFVSAKSPVVATLAMLIADEAPLVSVTICAGLVVPSPCDENVRLAGAIVTRGMLPAPRPVLPHL